MMSNKKFLMIVPILFLGACTSPTAMLGPAYTLSSTGSVYQSGLTYGSNELITMYTGKTPIENIKEKISADNNKNIQKKTLESEDFYILVKNKIEKTNGILNKSN
tara:strand:+ start:254 stop:568 length:315 start_codon:yes stop_codon:yes gene_type:complete